MRTRFERLRWVAAAALLIISANAIAGPLVLVRGHINFVDGPIRSANAVSIGDPYALTYAWLGLGNNALPADATTAWYPSAGGDMTFKVNALTVSAPAVSYVLSRLPNGQAFNIVSAFYPFAYRPGTQLTTSVTYEGLFPVYVGLEFPWVYPNSFGPPPDVPIASHRVV